jgi:hypothetical protein
MISTAPLAMLVIEGGVTRVRLRIVGWIENGLTPLLDQLIIASPLLLWSRMTMEGKTYWTDLAGPALTFILT